MKPIIQSWLPLCGLLSLGAVALVAKDEPPAPKSVIHLAEIDGRSWLVNAQGKPFFAHGITHMTVPGKKVDYAAGSQACKKLGFNAYGYGCPTPLKEDMPYMQGRNFFPVSRFVVKFKLINS